MTRSEALKILNLTEEDSADRIEQKFRDLTAEYESLIDSSKEEQHKKSLQDRFESIKAAYAVLSPAAKPEIETTVEVKPQVEEPKQEEPIEKEEETSLPELKVDKPEEAAFILMNSDEQSTPAAVRSFFLQTITDLEHRLEYAPSHVGQKYEDKIKSYRSAFAQVYPWVVSRDSNPSGTLHKSDAYAILGLRSGAAKRKVKERIREISASLDILETGSDETIKIAAQIERDTITRATVAIFPEFSIESVVSQKPSAEAFTKSKSKSRELFTDSKPLGAEDLGGWRPDFEFTKKKWFKPVMIIALVLIVGAGGTFGVKKFIDDRNEKMELARKKANKNLLKACKRGNFDKAETAITDGADVNHEDEDGVPAIMWAVYGGDMELVEMLIDEGADCDPQSGPMYVDGQNRYWETIWYASTVVAAAGEGHEDIMEFLVVDCGADVNKVDYNDEEDTYGMTPVMAAAKNGHDDVVKILIDEKVDLENSNEEGQTALMLAVIHDHTDVVKMLLKAGADYQASDDEGNTVYDHADSYSMRTLLEEYGADKFEYFNEFDKADAKFADYTGTDFGKEIVGGKMRMWQDADGYCNDTYSKFSVDKYDDFVLETKVRWIDGSKNAQFGIIFGRDDDDNYYAFKITANGEYELSKYYGGYKSSMIDKTYSGRIKKGTETNTLRIKKEGYSVYLYVNDEYLAYDYFYGSYGSQYGLTLCNEATVEFDYFKLTGDPD